MHITVWNDGMMVFRGQVGQFLQDNGYDEDLVKLCKGLRKAESVAFHEHHTGHWKIAKTSRGR